MVMYRLILAEWAKETREVSMAKAEGRMMRLPPTQPAMSFVDRARLSPGNALASELVTPADCAKVSSNWIFIDPANASTNEDLRAVVPSASIPATLTPERDELRVAITGVWRFPLASLTELKQTVLAKQDSQSQVRLSAMDVLTAYIWHRFVIAKYMLPRGDSSPTSSTIVAACDTRRRLNPPLPNDYLPACVDLMRCSVPLSASCSKEDGLKTVALMASSLRNANSTWTEKDYMNMLALAQDAPVSPGVVPRGPLDLLVTDHSRAPEVFSSDWGPGLGVAVAMREPYLGRTIPTGEVTMLPRCVNGDLEVMIAAERVVMERLRDDTDLAHYGKLLFLQHDVIAECSRQRSRSRL
jgi:hypothetical protein